MLIRQREDGTQVDKREDVVGVQRATIAPDSWDEKARTIKLVLVDERTATVRERDPWSGDIIDVELSLDPEHILRLDRINNGAPIMVVHGNVWLAGDRGIDELQIGKLVEGSVHVEGAAPQRKLVGEGVFSDNLAEREANHVRDIADGIRRNGSVGFEPYRVVITESDDGPDHHLVTDWEPMEYSSVPMGKDDNAMFRCLAPRQEQQQQGNVMPSKKKDDKADKGTERAADAGKGAEGMDPVAPAAAVDPAEVQRLVDAGIEAREKRATDIAQLALLPGVDEGKARGWIGEKADDGKTLITVDVARERAFALAEKEQVDKTRIVNGVRVEPGAYDEADVRGLRMVAYMLVHRAGYDSDKVRAAFAANRATGQAFVAPDFELKDFDFQQEGRHFMARSMLDLARLSLEADGIDTRMMGPDQIANAAFGYRYGRGLNTTSSFPLLLAEALNASVRMGYEEVPFDGGWARQTTSRDFRTKYTITMGETADLEVQDEKGEFGYSTMRETREGYRVISAGRVFGWTRELIVNDHLGGVTDIPRKFGRSVDRRKRLVLYSILTANAPMADTVALFHASRGNIDGTDSVASISAYDRMRVAMATRSGLGQDDDESPATVSFPLVHLVCAEKWRTHHQQQLGLIYVPPGIGVFDGPSNRAPAEWNQFKVHSDPLLDAYDAGGGVGNAWFGTDGESVEYAFLEGANGPSVAMREHFNNGGMEVRVSLDFGAGPIEARGMHRNNGAAS